MAPGFDTIDINPTQQKVSSTSCRRVDGSREPPQTMASEFLFNRMFQDENILKVVGVCFQEGHLSPTDRVGSKRYE